MNRLFALIVVGIVTATMPMTAWADKASRLNKKGIESFSGNNLEESVGHFTEALVERPESPELKFNLGTALSAVGKNDEALRELEQSAEQFTVPKNSAAAYFNAGNTSFNTGDLDGAIESYKSALKLDQSSRDIRHNLELVVRKLQEQQEQQQNKDQQKDDQENQDDQQEDQQNQDENEQDQDKQDEEKQDQDKQDDEQQDEQSEKDKNQQNQDENEQQQQEQAQNEEQLPMTPEEAQQLLDAIQDEENKALSLKKEKMRGEMRVGDDW